MGKPFVGVVIEESLEDKSILKGMKILKTEVEVVTERFKSKEKQWTLHTVRVSEEAAEKVADVISKTIKDAWYADFKNDLYHYIIFRNKIFHIDRQSKEEYDEARNYGISLGIPEYQVNFRPKVKK